LGEKAIRWPHSEDQTNRSVGTLSGTHILRSLDFTELSSNTWYCCTLCFRRWSATTRRTGSAGDGRRATGVDLASEVIIKVIDDWGIVLNIGYFMMDNAPNNDTMIAELSRGKDDVISREWPNLISDLLRNSRSIFDPKKRRLRCMGHILNLACKSQIGESG
jgi:hypothetical protein